MDKEEFTVLLGKKIRKLRKNLNISQSELALRCGKDRQHIALIENGKTTCTSFTLFLICKNLNTDIKNLFDF